MSTKSHSIAAATGATVTAVSRTATRSWRRDDTRDTNPTGITVAIAAYMVNARSRVEMAVNPAIGIAMSTAVLGSNRMAAMNPMATAGSTYPRA